MHLFEECTDHKPQPLTLWLHYSTTTKLLLFLLFLDNLLVHFKGHATLDRPLCDVSHFELTLQTTTLGGRFRVLGKVQCFNVNLY